MTPIKKINFTSNVTCQMSHVKRGFTLLETVISLGLLLLVVASFATFTLSVIDIRSKLQSQQEVQGNLRIALDTMSQKIRTARGVNIPSSTLGTNPGVLALILSDPTKNPTIFRLDQVNGILSVQEGVSPPQLITTKEVQVTQLIFSLYSPSGDPENIRIQMTAQYANQGNSYTSYVDSVQTSISLRR